MRIRNILLIFIPAIIVATFAFFVSFIQYQPDKIVYNDPNKLEALNIVPIFNEDIILGDRKAPKEIISFEDLGCSRCQGQMQIFEDLLNKYPGKVKIILKTLNVTTFPFASDEAHKYLFCANAQNKFYEFRNALLEAGQLDSDTIKSVSNTIGLNNESLQECLNSEELTNYIQKNEALAKQLGIESVPTTFIDDKVIQEPLNLAGWEALLSLP